MASFLAVHDAATKAKNDWHTAVATEKANAVNARIYRGQLKGYLVARYGKTSPRAGTPWIVVCRRQVMNQVQVHYCARIFPRGLVIQGLEFSRRLASVRERTRPVRSCIERFRGISLAFGLPSRCVTAADAVDACQSAFAARVRHAQTSGDAGSDGERRMGRSRARDRCARERMRRHGCRNRARLRRRRLS